MALHKPRASHLVAVPTAQVSAPKAASPRFKWVVRRELNTAWYWNGSLRGVVSLLTEGYLRHHGYRPSTARLHWGIASAKGDWYDYLVEGHTAPGVLDLEAGMLAVEAAWWDAERKLIENRFGRMNRMRMAA